MLVKTSPPRQPGDVLGAGKYVAKLRTFKTDTIHCSW